MTEKNIENLTKSAEEGNLESMVLLANALEVGGDLDVAVGWFTRAAEKKSDVATAWLIEFYRPIDEVTGDRFQFLHWLERLAEEPQPDCDAMLHIAVIYRDGLFGFDVNFLSMVYWLRRANDIGSDQASHLLGLAYFKGTGVEQNKKTAQGLFQSASTNGYVPSMAMLAECYLDSNNGINISDSDAFFHWANEAASQGNPAGMFHLANANKAGLGTAIDNEKFIYWTKLAAENDEPRALFNLSQIYNYSNNTDLYPQQYMRVLTKAASLDDPRALLNLAHHYGYGLHVEQDYEMASTLLRSAANLGNADAMYSIAFSLRESEVLEGNEEKHKNYVYWISKAAEKGQHAAIGELCGEYLRLAILDRTDSRLSVFASAAAESGNARAMYTLGMAHRMGCGVGISLTLAHRWILRAANKGFPVAMIDIATVYRDGVGVTQSDNLYFQWSLKAAKADSLDGMKHVVLAYYEGTGVERDLQKCKEWLKQTAKAGDSTAHILLTLLQLEIDFGLGSEDLFETAKPFIKLQREAAAIKSSQLVESTTEGISHFTSLDALESILSAAKGNSSLSL